jgi:Tfp pilus assembly protein PilO
MHRNFTFPRRFILGILIVLLLADAGLAFFSWQLAAAPKTPEQVLAHETTQVKILRGEVARADKIRADLPATVADCDRFERSLLSASTGYSTVTAELGDLARKSGLRLQGVNFHQTEVQGRPLYKIEMEAAVAGDYPSVIKFLNGLQRSGNVYVVEALSLGTQTQTPGQAPGTEGSDLILVSLHLRTYFRSAA